MPKHTVATPWYKKTLWDEYSPEPSWVVQCRWEKEVPYGLEAFCNDGLADIFELEHDDVAIRFHITTQKPDDLDGWEEAFTFYDHRSLSWRMWIDLLYEFIEDAQLLIGPLLEGRSEHRLHRLWWYAEITKEMPKKR